MSAVAAGRQTRPAARAADGKWIAGQSGNPGGQAKGFASLIRETTHGGADLIAYVSRVLHDEKEKTHLRLEAATWLADRGFGKPSQSIELSGAEGAPLTIFLAPPPPEQLADAALELEAARAAQRALPAG